MNKDVIAKEKGKHLFVYHPIEKNRTFNKKKTSLGPGKKQTKQNKKKNQQQKHKKPNPTRSPYVTTLYLLIFLHF